jgi:lysyl-tRNA synthetase class 2
VSPSLDTLRQRAQLLAQIRAYFSAHNVLEVDVPALGTHTVTDPNLEALVVQHGDTELFLQTSPEYFMKRLLADGVGDSYYLGKAFRADERGRLHQPEFTMLEWYRLGMNDERLMDDIESLLKAVGYTGKVERLSYHLAFFQATGLFAHEASVGELKRYAKAALDVDWQDDDRSLWLALLFTHCVEPKLKDRAVFIYDFPIEQAALARLGTNSDGCAVAKRFELYINGVELANGYWELCDAVAQRKRFEEDNKNRRAQLKPEKALDPNFIAAMEKGLPECAGVALGIERLLMVLLGENSISSQTFSELR